MVYLHTSLFLEHSILGDPIDQEFRRLNKRKDAMKELATFAGGCFWCMEPPFRDVPGVQSVMPGYMGGHVVNPTYEQVCGGQTGHAEVVQISFDNETCQFSTLLEIFWRNIDPTTVDRQFADRGTQYRTGIFFHNESQREVAEKSKQELASKGKFTDPIVTELVPAADFWPAESYHCQYDLKNPSHYHSYKENSGRAAFIRSHWDES